MKYSIESIPQTLIPDHKEIVKNKKIGALIVAAGMSSRMKAFKPLLPMGADTMIQCVIRRLQEGGVQYIVVVTGNQAHLVERHLKDWPITFVKNQRYDRTQMFDSILLGMEKLRGQCDAFFVLPVDTPMFRPESLLKMIEALETYDSDGVRPSYHGKHGHPVLFSEKSMDAICRHDGRKGLKGAMQSLNMMDMILEDQGILYDADTPADYQGLCKYRWTCVPTEGEIQQIYNLFGATEAIKAHCKAVSQAALEISQKLEQAGWNGDQRLIGVAARLHDAAKKFPDHAGEASRLIEKMGYGKVAEIVRAHMDLPEEAARIIDERAIVYLADKLVIEDQRTTLEERLIKIKRKFGMNERIMQSIAKRFFLAKQVSQKIEEILGEVKK